MRLLFLISIIFLFFPASYAQDNCSRFLKILDFTIDETPFTEIQDVLGYSKIFETGAGGEWRKHMGYKIKGTDIILMFEADSFGGDHFNILEIRRASKEDKNKFPEISVDIKDLEVGGLKLGMFKKELENIKDREFEWDKWKGNDSAYSCVNCKTPLSQEIIDKYIEIGYKSVADMPSQDDIVCINLFFKNKKVDRIAITKRVSW